jgi:hypothetical protein
MSMATIEQAIQVVAQAERGLRDLVGQAAANGEYDVVDRLTEAARTIGVFARTWRNGERVAYDSAIQRGQMCDPAQGHSPLASTETPAATRRRVVGPGRRSKKLPAKGEYPRFFRHADNLVKVGWSKKRREEYVHKAPRRVIEALADAVTRRSANGRIFTAEELFPLKDPQDGSEIPGYQAYVALAWFKAAGLVKQQGRSGYTVVNGPGLSQAVPASWNALAAQ